MEAESRSGRVCRRAPAHALLVAPTAPLFLFPGTNGSELRQKWPSCESGQRRRRWVNATTCERRRPLLASALNSCAKAAPRLPAIKRRLPLTWMLRPLPRPLSRLPRPLHQPRRPRPVKKFCKPTLVKLVSLFVYLLVTQNLKIQLHPLNFLPSSSPPQFFFSNIPLSSSSSLHQGPLRSGGHAGHDDE